MNSDKIKEIFNQSQITTASHQRQAVLLKKIYEENDDDSFFDELKIILMKCLMLDYKQKNIYVNRTLEFFSSFCSTLKPTVVQCDDDEDMDELIEHPLLTKIFDFLLETQSVTIDCVRVRSCQLINKILDHLVGMDLSDSLCKKLEENLLERLFDSKSVVRLEAVMSLYRLQDPTNQDDAIIREFIVLINSNIPAKIRQLCVEKIAARRDVIQHILTRIRDVDVNVRLAAYKRLTKFVKHLKITERRQIIHCGYLDSSEIIKNYLTSTFLLSWLEQYDNNILQLMESLRLDAFEKDINETSDLFEYVLNSLFPLKPLNDLTGVVPINENKLVPYEKLNWEVMAYWRIYVQYLRQKDEFEDEVDLILPELVHFCRYIHQYYENAPKELTRVEFLERQFIIKQMFLITKTYDFSDISSRQCLNFLISKILEKAVLTGDVIEHIVSNLELTITKPDARARFISEIISEIMYPMNSEEAVTKVDEEKNFQLSQMKVKIHRLAEDQKMAIEKEDYLEANRIKLQMEELNVTLKNLQNAVDEPQVLVKRTDPPTILKYLNIAVGLLISPQITTMTSTLQALRDDVVLELLMHENDTIRAKALHCYSCFCIIDRKSAYDGIHIFSTPIFAYKSGDECDTQILLVCIAGAVDLIRIYGSKLMAEPSDEEDGSESRDEEHLRIFAGGTSLTDLIQGLVDLMDDEVLDVQRRAAQGLCSLILDGRVHSPSLIARLILKWCSPASAPGLKQLIGRILQEVPKLPDSAQQLEGSVLLTMKALAFAPEESPLADVNVENIARFLISLCRMSKDWEQIHSNLANTICCSLKDKPKYRLNTVYSKMLLMLEVPRDKYIIQDLLTLCNEIRDEIHDRTALNNVIKFMAVLAQNNQNEVPAIIEEEEDVDMDEGDANNSRSM